MFAKRFSQQIHRNDDRNLLSCAAIYAFNLGGTT